MIYKANKDRDIPNQGASSLKSIQAERQRNEEMVEKISPIVNVPTMKKKGPVGTQNTRRIKRVNGDPNMFYQVDIIHSKPFLSRNSSKNGQANTKRNENQLEEPTTCFVIPVRETPATSLPPPHPQKKNVK